MAIQANKSDECIILVKALPHLSSSYYETVCCAGVGRDHKWRRLYPVPFRVLDGSQQFGRWHWVQYDYIAPKNDKRLESQKVQTPSINVLSKIKDSERAALAEALTRESLEDAESRNETLTLLKPTSLQFTWRKKNEKQIAAEVVKHAALANQLSAFDKPATPLEPCPYQFRVTWSDRLGAIHRHTNDDWETSTAFFRRRHALGGEEAALQSLRDTYENLYMTRGMRLALGTHSRRDNQWLLVGMLRVDDTNQPQLRF